jgi:peroxiredoxin
MGVPMKIAALMLSLTFSLSIFALEIGQPAPPFETESAGFEKVAPPFQLSHFKGKIIVLEWLNHGCPFVRKHYESGNMQSLQKKYVAKDIMWFSVISSAPGNQGYVTAVEAQENMKKHHSHAHRVLLDPEGKIGKMYGAKTTPHLYIIDKNGNLAYQGAIDDVSDTNQESVKQAKNYVARALDELLLNKKVTLNTTKAYGCSVKY